MFYEEGNDPYYAGDEFRESNIEPHHKGFGCEFRPQVGETFFISGPNNDDENGYAYTEMVCLEVHENGLRAGVPGCHPHEYWFGHAWMMSVEDANKITRCGSCSYYTPNEIPRFSGVCSKYGTPKTVDPWSGGDGYDGERGCVFYEVKNEKD